MLHQFTFSNFKSFKEETTLDLIASSITEHSQDVANDCYDERVLKVAAIYGANASGKSNVLKAFGFMRDYILLSFFNSKDIEVESSNLQLDSFRFDNSNNPSSFEALFSISEDIYQYGFIFNNNQVQEEFLYIRDKKSKAEKFNILFYREGNKLSDVANDLKQISKLSANILNPNILFLSFAANLDIPIARKIYNWFISTRVMDYGQDSSERRMFSPKYSPIVKLLKDEKQKEALTKFVKAIDLGIEGFDLIENELLSPTGSEKSYQIITHHKNIDDNSLVSVPLSNESSGTKKMISLFIPISEALQEGKLLFIDELDAKLHPLLIRYLLILFHTKENNPKNAQLVFATHDVFTLDKSNFRRDEIWFVDKDENGVSELYSLDSYLIEDKNGDQKKVRKDASYGKDYILGKYKSVPKLNSLPKED